MSPAVLESPATGIAPPARPSVWRVGWATFFGYFLTVLVGVPLVLGLYELGIDVPGRNAAGRGVFHAYDIWGWVAEAFVSVLATFITAWFVSDSVRRRTGWEVPFSFTFVTLLLTGYAPLLALTPLYEATAPVSLVVATLLLRWRAAPAGAEPFKVLGAVPRRYRRWVLIALAVAGPLMFAYVLAYGATHPLQWSGTWGDRTYKYEPGELARYQLFLSGGRFPAKDLSVIRVEGSPALQLERVGVEAHRWSGRENAEHPSWPPLHPLGDYRVSSDYGRDPITLELRQGQVCPAGIAKLDAVWVRYTVLGMRHEQRIPLGQPPAVRCP